MGIDFDIGTLENIFDLLPEACCPDCNALIPARDGEYMQWRESVITREQWEGSGAAEYHGISYDEIDPRTSVFTCLACGATSEHQRQLEYPFEHDGFLSHLTGIASALRAFPPFVNYGVIDPWRVPSDSSAEFTFRQSSPVQSKVAIDPYDALIGAFESARWRVHFMTWTIDEDIVVELRQLANKNGIKVRGIVGIEHRKGNGQLKSEVSPEFSLMVANDPETARLYSHTKLVVIDGVAAIKGSANLRRDSFRAMAETPPKELIEAVTSIRQALALNNQIFAPVWAALMRKHREQRK